MTKKRLGSVVVVLAAAAACGGTRGKMEARAPARGAPTTAGSSCGAPSAARPIGRSGSSATLALARVEGKRVAYVADEDAKAILTVDLDERREIARTDVGGAPSHVLVTSDGRVLATVRDRAELVVLVAAHAAAPLARACSARTPVEPIAIATTPDDATVVVSAGWGRRLAAFDARTLAPRFETALPREPRAVVVSDDGKTAFVSHAVGSIVSAVDLAGAKHEARSIAVRGWLPGERERERVARSAHANGHPSCQGFALAKSDAAPGRIFAPQVMVDPGDPERRPDGYGDENQQTETPAVAVLDEGAGEPLGSSVTIGRENMFRRMRDTRDARPECLLPRAAAIDPDTKALLVTCYGIDAVVAYDARSANPLTSERRRWTVGSGPSGVVVDAEKRRAVVWSQFDRTLSVIPLGGTELVDDKAAPPVVLRANVEPLKEKLPAEYALGRILFHAAGDARISADGRACASCHPDGRDDAITWATPEGPRRSIMLAGRARSSPPYSWNGNEASLHAHLGNTFDRLSGKGLRSIELDSLVAYVSAMPAPPAPSPDAPDAAKVARGKAIFASAEVGCAGCHAGPSTTDGKNHDVGSKHKADRGAAFNTPSLRFVGGTGPYFHDGRYATLGELLTKSKMGDTSHLAAADLEALEAYLRTL